MKLTLNLKKLLLAFLLSLFIFINTSFVLAEETNSNSETQPPTLKSEAGILIDTKSEKILYGKNEDKKMYPASTTKILTAILSIENSDLNDLATVSYDAVMSIPDGYSVADLQVDEHISIEYLLELLLLHSANDAANVLAEHVGGSFDSFASMMNTKVYELGLSNTHFTNAYGKHDENHYSTAHDLAIIMKYCMQNETFRKICGKISCSIPATDKHEARSYTSTNKLVLSDDTNYYPYTTCGKTGFTSQAGYCLVSCSYKDDFETICVIFGGENLKDSSTRFAESKKLFEYGYNNYSIKTLLAQENVVTNIEVKNGSKDTKSLDLLASSSLEALLENSFSESELNFTIDLKPDIRAPIAEGDILGSVSCKLDGEEYKTDLVASHSVTKSKLFIYMFEFGVAGLIIILIIIYIRLCSKKKSKH